MKLFSAFSGGGGIDRAFMNVFPEGKIAGHCEVDPHCVKCNTETIHTLLNHFISECRSCGKKKKQWASGVYQYHYGGHNYGDIKLISGRELPGFDIFSFGFPCQDISIAGKGAGFTGKRSSLFYQAIRIINENRPEFILFENVKGLFSSQQGRDFAEVLRAIADIGYDGEWQLLNTKWLLPQNRERIFFVGYPAGRSRRPIFPFTESDFTNEEKNKTVQTATDRRVAGTLNTRNNSPDYVFDKGTTLIVHNLQKQSRAGNRKGKREDETAYSVASVPMQAVEVKAISAHPRTGKGKGGKGILSNENNFYSVDATNKQLIQVGQLDEKDSEATRVYDPAGIARTIKNGGWQGAKTGLYVVSTTGLGSKYQHREETYPPLRAKDRADIRIIGNTGIRRLTPFECCKLQGYNDIDEQDPDKCYTKYALNDKGEKVIVPETHQYKIIGNGVTSTVVEMIFRKLKQAI